MLFRKKMWQQAIISLLLATHCYAGDRQEYFTAAVFEYRHVHDIETMNPEEIKESNLKWMERAAAEAAIREADILVFPEFGTFPPGEREFTQEYAEFVPDPQKMIFNPCDEGDSKEMKVLSSFSCMAKNYNIYIVGHLVDKQPCTKESQTCDKENIQDCDSSLICPEDGHFMYNTGVAFDEKGNLIARYHKNHLYFESLDTPAKPEMITFSTEFGTFGLIVCFDSVFEDAVNLVKKHGVETLIFPNLWFDEVLPFQTVEWQQSWAIANKVNFIAANKHVPGNGTLGSGIYSKHLGALIYTYNPDGKSKLLVSKVPRYELDIKNGLQNNPTILIVEDHKVYEVKETGDSFPEICLVDQVGPPKDMDHDYRCYKRQVATHSLKKLEQAKGKIETCHNEFCCLLEYEASSMNEDYYLTAFNGENNVRGYYKWKEETCLLVRCDPLEKEFCASFPPKAKTVFRSFELKAKFKSESIYPTVSKSRQRLAPKSEWKFTKTDNYVTLTFNSKSNNPLLKAGLLGRDYEKDPSFVPYPRFVF